MGGVGPDDISTSPGHLSFTTHWAGSSLRPLGPVSSGQGWSCKVPGNPNHGTTVSTARPPAAATPRSPTLPVLLASWRERFGGKGLPPNSIWPQQLRLSSYVTSLQSVNAVHRSQSRAFTKEALGSQILLQPQPPTRLWFRLWFRRGSQRGDQNAVGRTCLRSRRCPEAVSGQGVPGRGWGNLGTSKFPVPLPLGKDRFLSESDHPS